MNSAIRTEEQVSLPDRDELAVLRSLVEGTVNTTGEKFFQALVRNLAAAIDVRHAFIAEFTQVTSRVRMLAYCADGQIVDNVEYNLAGTPCEDVVRGSLCHHPRGIQQSFPDDRMLVDMGIESYLGVPLLNGKGDVLGHLAVFDSRPMPEEPRRSWIFRIFAERAAAELERLRMEQIVLASEQRFRDLFDEAPIAYVFEDTETRFVHANRAAMKLLGLKPEDVPGTVGLSLVAPNQVAQERVHDAFTDIKQGKERGFMELELRRKDDGRPVWVQFWSRPEPDGLHTRTMIVDITDRVLAQQEKARLQQQNEYLREEIEANYGFEEIVGESPSLQKVLRKVEQVAQTDSTVLIVGETGTGKELIARAVHSRSKRKDGPLIKLNCAALPTGLVESELFGHEKGAFTGALEKRIGRFVLAHGGTIFLDEIGDMPLEVQVKLLRVLQEQEFESIGGTKSIRVDVRVIAATNRDLAKAVADGSFRADLYYRLNVFPINLPPLRERASDIRILAHYFTSKYARRIGRPIEQISESAMEQLSAYSWPGNIRELENVIERAVILSRGNVLEFDAEFFPSVATVTSSSPARPLADTQPAATAPRPSAPVASPAPAAAPDDESLETIERKHILAVLARTGWRIDGKGGAAQILDLHPNTLRSRLKKLGLSRPTQ